MNTYFDFLLILLLGALGTWLFFYEFKARSWGISILQSLGFLVSFSLIVRLVKDSSSRLSVLALLIVLVGFLITRNYLGLKHWWKTGDRAGLWSTIGLDATVIILVLAGLHYWKFQ